MVYALHTGTAKGMMSGFNSGAGADFPYKERKERSMIKQENFFIVGLHFFRMFAEQSFMHDQGDPGFRRPLARKPDSGRHSKLPFFPQECQGIGAVNRG